MSEQGKRKQLAGIIISNKMEKTVVVRVDRLIMHSRFCKYVKRRSKFAAHDEKNICNVGDKVLITESRPLSKTKRWRVSKILERQE